MKREEPKTCGLTDEQQKALDRFIEAVRTHYREQLRTIVLFGSRARGDFTAESDVDLAIVLTDGNWDCWEEKARIGDWAVDVLIDHDLYIQPWPIALSHWEHPERFGREAFIRSIKRDARPLPAAA
jgi:antitoxin ChpS